MFENEAKEKAKRKIYNFIVSTWGVSQIRTEQTYETVEGVPHFYQFSLEKMWQDGAEYGYNKANEWHKADVPTTPMNKVVLGYIKDCNIKKFCLVKWNGEWWYDARTWNDKVKLIAWKEIVLPKGD